MIIENSLDWYGESERGFAFFSHNLNHVILTKGRFWLAYGPPLKICYPLELADAPLHVRSSLADSCRAGKAV